MQHLGIDELTLGMAAVEPSPTTAGTVEMIVVRARPNERATPTEVAVTTTGGLSGDRWSKRSDRYPESQVSLINSGVIDLIAGTRDRWALAGDNLVVDFDIGEENLPIGTRFSVGSAILEVSPEPHAGCSKFSSRFGEAAREFVNLGDGPRQRLRGMYATVVRDGVIAVGDVIKKT